MAKKGLLSIFTFWADKHVKYARIRDGEERQKSKYFGVQSIIESVVGLVIIGLSIWGIIALANALSVEMGFLQIIAIIFLGLLIINALVYCPIQSFICLIYQLLLNKKAVGWVALGIWIATIVGFCVEIVLLVKFII